MGECATAEAQQHQCVRAPENAPQKHDEDQFEECMTVSNVAVSSNDVIPSTVESSKKRKRRLRTGSEPLFVQPLVDQSLVAPPRKKQKSSDPPQKKKRKRRKRKSSKKNRPSSRKSVVDVMERFESDDVSISTQCTHSQIDAAIEKLPNVSIAEMVDAQNQHENTSLSWQTLTKADKLCFLNMNLCRGCQGMHPNMSCEVCGRWTHPQCVGVAPVSEDPAGICEGTCDECNSDNEQ